MKGHISHERLRELLDYNPEKGVFTWNETISPRARAGDPAGYLTIVCILQIPSRYFGCQGDIQRDMLCI